MATLVLQPTVTAQWQALIKEAEAANHLALGDDLESYLVFLLMRFMEKPEIAKSVLAMDYLQALQSIGKQIMRLQEVGDKCLLFAGLFPERAERKRVRISYFVELGQSAYSSIADLSKIELAKFYQVLCKRFVGLMDILHTARDLASQHLTPLQAMDLWQDLQSPHALRVLRRYTQGTFVNDVVKTDKRH